MVLLNRKGKLPEWRWYFFKRLFNSTIFAGNFLFAILHNEKPSVKLSDKEFSIKLNLDLTGNMFLKDLAFVYWHILGKVPGRSKSTIGPFIRFAHAAMVAFVGEGLSPSIETVNERWARLDFDPRTKILNEAQVREYCSNRGIIYPF
jgi:hypothetical protein